jgi:hypothetical protein
MNSATFRGLILPCCDVPSVISDSSTLKELTELEVLAAKHIRNRALVSEIRNQLAL